MILVLDSRRNIGLIMMVIGLLIAIVSICSIFPTEWQALPATCIGDFIMGEIVFIIGIGLYRGKHYAHIYNLFDDCETRTGIMCSIMAGFGLAYLIDGIVSIVAGDSVNTIGNVTSALIFVIAPVFIINFKKRTVGRVAHVIICMAVDVTLITNAIYLIFSIWTYDLLSSFDALLCLIVIFIATIYVADSEVKKDIWDTTQEPDVKSQSV